MKHAGIEDVRRVALGLPGVEEKAHWERPSFRVRKKIFATLWVAERVVVVKLTVEEQSVFCEAEGGVFEPVPGGWGRQGWTRGYLDRMHPDLLEDVLGVAYGVVAG